MENDQKTSAEMVDSSIIPASARSKHFSSVDYFDCEGSRKYAKPLTKNIYQHERERCYAAVDKKRVGFV